MFFRLQNFKGKSTILSKQSIIYMGSSTKNKKFVSTLFSFFVITFIDVVTVLLSLSLEETTATTTILNL